MPYSRRLSKLRAHRLRFSKLGWAKAHGLGLYRLKLYGSEAGVGGKVKLYTPLKKNTSRLIEKDWWI